MGIELDVFPAAIATPDGMLDSARMVVRGGRMYVFVRDGHSAAARYVGDNPTVEGQGPSWTVTTEEGLVFKVQAGGGCGCGNPLRRMGVHALLALVEDGA